MAYELLSILATTVAPVIGKIAEYLISYLGLPFMGSLADMNKAVEVYSERIKEQHYPPMLEAALISNARHDIRKYKNKCDVLKLALEEMNEHADAYSEESVKNINNDWLDSFFDSCAEFSNIEVQAIFARVLTSEAKEQNSIPKSLFHSLSLMDSLLAKKFSILCQHTISFANQLYTYCDYKETPDYWKKAGLLFDDLIYLQEIGLITFSIGFYNTTFTPTNTLPIRIGEEKSFHLHKSATFNKIDRGHVSFTRSGLALCKSLNMKSTDEQVDHTISCFSKDGFIVFRA